MVHPREQRLEPLLRDDPNELPPFYAEINTLWSANPTATPVSFQMNGPQPSTDASHGRRSGTPRPIRRAVAEDRSDSRRIHSVPLLYSAGWDSALHSGAATHLHGLTRFGSDLRT